MRNAIVSMAKGFLSSRFNRYLVVALVLVGIFAYYMTNGLPISQGDGNEDFVINFFYLPTCPHCAEQKPVIEQLQQEMPEIKIIWHDASSASGSELFYRLAQEAGMDTSRLGVPTTFVGKHPLVGVHSKEDIITAINECMETCESGGPAGTPDSSQEVSPGFTDYELPFLGRIDLTAYSLPALAVTLGLIDGFNPCAMWVLVYLISLLIGLNDRKKIWLIVGSFVLASGILYFLFMTAWLNIFLFVGYVSILTIAIGLVALGGGILNIREYIVTKGNISCKVGDAEAHKKTMQKIQGIIAQPLSLPIIVSIIGLAFVVNSVEFVCSSAIPAVFTQILTLSQLPALTYYAYIGLYVLFFMLDDLIIFGMAAFAVNSTLGMKYAKYCKILGGIILFLLGIILLFAPHLLR